MDVGAALAGDARRRRRHGLGWDAYTWMERAVTPEQYQPAARPSGGGLWEACQTLNGSWGYDRDNVDYKPVETDGAARAAAIIGSLL